LSLTSRTLTALVILPAALCQEVSPGNPHQPGTVAPGANSSDSNEPEKPDKRIFWIIPNFRTSPTLAEYKPITPKEKFKIAAMDTFDRGTFALAAAFAGEAQLSNATPSFGQGVRGYARYLGTAYADFAIGDFMTEGIYPTILRQDPRYFRRGTGSGWSRLGYAIGQIFWTHTDSGGTQFNFSEVVGNSTAVAISEAYYPNNRTASDAVSKLGVQLAVDTASNVLKEFWPDLSRKFSRTHTEPGRGRVPDGTR
jgi:hypothetical protein